MSTNPVILYSHPLLRLTRVYFEILVPIMCSSHTFYMIQDDPADAEQRPCDARSIKGQLYGTRALT